MSPRLRAALSVVAALAGVAVAIIYALSSAAPAITSLPLLAFSLLAVAAILAAPLHVTFTIRKDKKP